jgi:hypothetical protein
MKIRALGAELLPVDGGTDRKTPDYANSMFAKIFAGAKK